MLNLSFCTVRYCLMSTKDLYATDLTYFFLSLSGIRVNGRLYNHGEHLLPIEECYSIGFC